MIVNIGVDRDELVQRLYLSERQHRPLMCALDDLFESERYQDSHDDNPNLT